MAGLSLDYVVDEEQYALETAENAPIHTSDDVAEYIVSRGYCYAYLPSYFPELNPIEQFLSVPCHL
ncbi:hypothetical protein DFQ28_006762 [Apophysomyces sp. BC1034]|nr:hypothetical protein DFQ28_006762 [Apophysomyces sp. BC1034]